MKKPGIFNKYRAFTWQREKDSNYGFFKKRREMAINRVDEKP